jgi:outer membrane protein assembly factor BamB
MLFMTAPDGGCGMFAVKPEGTGDITSSIAWKQSKGFPKRASSTLVGNLLFSGNDSGIIVCMDIETGDVVWQERVGGVFTASPISCPGRIYFFAEDGTTTVIAPEKEFKLLATNKLKEGFMATPAVAGNALVLRTMQSIYLVE